MLQITLLPGNGALDPLIFSGLFLLGIRVMFLIGMLLYFIFAVLVLRQISIMKKTLISPFSPVVQLLGFLHLAMVMLLVLMFLIIL